jgi:hypothetical protein
VGKTDAGLAHEDCLEIHRAAEVKLRAYKHLKDPFSATGDMLLTPLRFAINVLGKVANAILSIESIIIDGAFSGKSSKVAAAVKCKVAGFAYDFMLSIDLGDIVSLFSELWDKIKSVIPSVAAALSMLRDAAPRPLRSSVSMQLVVSRRRRRGP